MNQHHKDCPWQVDQYPHECTCELSLGSTSAEGLREALDRELAVAKRTLSDSKDHNETSFWLDRVNSIETGLHGLSPTDKAEVQITPEIHDALHRALLNSSTLVEVLPPADKALPTVEELRTAIVYAPNGYAKPVSFLDEDQVEAVLAAVVKVVGDGRREEIARELIEAANGLLARMSGTYKARNGREMGIEADDGEKCWIVHSDDIEALRRAASAIRDLGSTSLEGEG